MTHTLIDLPGVERFALGLPMHVPEVQMTIHALVYEGWILHRGISDHLPELQARTAQDAKKLADEALVALCTCYEAPPLIECIHVEANGDPAYGPTSFGVAVGLRPLPPGEAPTAVMAGVILPAEERRARPDPRTHQS